MILQSYKKKGKWQALAEKYALRGAAELANYAHNTLVIGHLKLSIVFNSQDAK